MDKFEFSEITTHICTVGTAVVPNIAPILDVSLGVKKVILIHTSDFLKKAELLAKTYKYYQIKTEFYPISSAWDIALLNMELEKLLEGLGEEKIAINITVGSKPISIVLHDIANILEIPTYYMNRNNTISWFIPKELKGNKPTSLQDRIKAKPFLMASGIELVSSEQPYQDKKIRSLIDNIVIDIEKYKKAIPQLNYLASLTDSLTSKPVQGNDEGFKELIDMFEEAGLLSIKNKTLIFKDEKARFFANGGWLEEFIYHQIKQLSSKMPEIQDNKFGANVQTIAGEVKNEIDNLILYNNNLCLIECKTKRFTKDAIPDGGAVQSIYKLDSLKESFGGIMSKGMVVSVFDFTPSDIKRAKEYGIKIISLSELKNIKSHLSNWLKEAV